MKFYDAIWIGRFNTDVSFLKIMLTTQSRFVSLVSTLRQSYYVPIMNRVFAKARFHPNNSLWTYFDQFFGQILSNWTYFHQLKNGKISLRCGFSHWHDTCYRIYSRARHLFSGHIALRWSVGFFSGFICMYVKPAEKWTFPLKRNAHKTRIVQTLVLSYFSIEYCHKSEAL